MPLKTSRFFQTKHGFSRQKRIKHCYGIIILTSLLLSLTTPTYHASGPFDSFHEGETLGAAISLLEGKIPYKDVVFSHGVFHDPLRSIIAMELFGKSIGAVRAVTSFLKILSFIFLGLLTLRLFDDNGSWALLSFFILFFLIPESTFILLPRDLITFFYLILLTLVPSQTKYTPAKISVLSFLLAFIPVITFGITIDRAFYLTALYILLYPVLFFGFFRKTPWRSIFIRFSFFGILTGTIALTVLLQGAIVDFGQFVFIHVPKTKEFADGLPYPLFSARYLTILLLISSICYWLTVRCLCFCSKKQFILYFLAFCKKYFNSIMLCLIAVFCFRNALGRSDDEHLAYSSLLPILTFLYIAIYYYIAPRTKALLYKLVTLSTLLTSCIYVIVTLYSIFSSNCIAQNFPVFENDSTYIPQEYKKTISFLIKNLTGDEKFVTFTNEASWYYFIDQASPTRFPLVWFALSQENQKAFIESIQQQNIRFILYRNKHWANTIDGIPNEARLPLLFKYVSQNYRPLINIDGNEIWEKIQ